MTDGGAVPAEYFSIARALSGAPRQGDCTLGHWFKEDAADQDLDAKHLLARTPAGLARQEESGVDRRPAEWLNNAHIQSWSVRRRHDTGACDQISID